MLIVDVSTRWRSWKAYTSESVVFIHNVSVVIWCSIVMLLMEPLAYIEVLHANLTETLICRSSFKIFTIYFTNDLAYKAILHTVYIQSSNTFIHNTI
jgi:hypothetical protein